MFRDLLALRSEMDFGALNHQRSPDQAALSSAQAHQTLCEHANGYPESSESMLTTHFAMEYSNHSSALLGKTQIQPEKQKPDSVNYLICIGDTLQVERGSHARCIAHKVDSEGLPFLDIF